MQQVEKSLLSAEELNLIRKNLTFLPLQKNSSALPFHAFAENESFIRTPKFFPLREYNIFIKVSFVPALCMGSPAAFTINTDDKTPLRPLQAEAAAIILRRLRKATPQRPRGALLCLPCGYGKTRTAAFVAQQLGVVALVLVANKQLAIQFERALHDLSPDIRTAQLPKPTAPFPEDAHVIFTTLQAIHARRPPPAFLCRIGLLIVDEAHHLAAPTFCQAMCTLAAARVLALTATPERPDGKERLVYYLGGDTAFRAYRPLSNNLSLLVLKYPVPPGFGRIRYSSLVERMQLIVQLANIPARNALLVASITGLALRQGKEARAGILVLGKLVAHLHCLAELCGIVLQNNSRNIFLTGAESQEQRDEAAKQPLIFATYDLCKEGLDIPRLDTLILVSPAESLVQCVGRILRDHAGKQAPLVVDVSDDCGAFRHEVQARRRKFAAIGAHEINE